jgi:hypothetical protein
MSLFFTYFIYALATWRIANMLVTEDGPGSIFVWLRKCAECSQFTKDLLGCVWCTSVWVGAIWVSLDVLIPSIAFKLAMVFAFSAGALVVHRWFESKE